LRVFCYAPGQHANADAFEASPRTKAGQDAQHQAELEG
jgi:hypothetical protein